MSPELQEHVEQALARLEEQSQRIEEFHKQSLRWHRQHHETLAAMEGIVTGLRGQQLSGLPQQQQQEPSKPATPHEPKQDIRARVYGCLERGDLEEVKELFEGMKLNQWRAFGAEGFVRLLPLLTTWLGDPSTAKTSLRMVYEGAKLWSDTLAHAQFAPIVSRLRFALAALNNPSFEHHSDAVDLLSFLQGLHPNVY